MNAAVAARAKDFPQMEIVFADAQQDNARQVADVETFLQQGIDLLMISPNEAKPLTAVVRINGQFFAYVVEKEGDKTVARQKGVTLGPLSGNDYIVLDGLKPGEQLITGGIQKIRDGAPVMAGGPPAGAPGASAQQKAS